MASDGAEAIALAKERSPDIILMDIMLAGGMDGIEAAKHIRALVASFPPRPDSKDPDAFTGQATVNAAQLATLFKAGYTGYASFEPFAEEIAAATDIEQRLASSMAWLQSAVAAASAEAVAA